MFVLNYVYILMAMASIVFPETAPGTRRELLDFITANFEPLKSRYIAYAVHQLESITLEDVHGKLVRAAKEYGQFKLFEIDADVEGMEELTDGVVYFAINLLQSYFGDNV